MDYIINFLSIVIIWSAIYYYINNSSQKLYEPFQSSDIEEQITEEQITEEQPTEGQPTEGQPTEGQPTEGQPKEEKCTNNFSGCGLYNKCSDIVSYTSKSQKMTMNNALNLVKAKCKLKCGLCNDCKYWTYSNNISYNTPIYAKNVCQSMCNRNKNCIGFHIKKISDTSNRCFTYSSETNNLTNETNNLTNEKLEQVDFKFKMWIYTKNSYNKYTLHKEPIDFCQINSKKQVNYAKKTKQTEFEIKNNLVETIPENSLCSFKAWGPDKISCINRCKVWSRTNEKYKCSDSQCSTICEECTNDEVCDWLKEKVVEETNYLDKPSNIRCIAGDKQVLIDYIYESENSNDSKKPEYFIIQYFKTRDPHEGIKLIKIKNSSNKIHYELNNVLNDIEYSISVYPIINNKENKNQMSNIINISPQSYIKIY